MTQCKIEFTYQSQNHPNLKSGPRVVKIAKKNESLKRNLFNSLYRYGVFWMVKLLPIDYGKK